MQKNVTEYWLNRLQDKDFCKKIAVKDGDNEITFDELFNRSGELGAFLIRNISETGKPVAVFLPKSAELIAADMAIIYSGNAYMNLDTKQPARRTEMIIKHIQPICILTDGRFKKFFDESNLPGVKIIYLDELKLSGYEISVIKNRLSEVIDADPLCLVNTSGSTGIPKGVVMNHRSVIDFIDDSFKVLPLDEEGIIGSLSPAYFDIFTFEFYLMLWKGYKFVIVPESLAAFPLRLVECLEDDRHGEHCQRGYFIVAQIARAEKNSFCRRSFPAKTSRLLEKKFARCGFHKYVRTDRNYRRLFVSHHNRQRY